MLYKVIRAKKFVNYLFDLDSGDTYEVINRGNCCNAGYFMIKRQDDTNWKMIKQVPNREFWTRDASNALPLLTRIKLFQFLSQNLGHYKSIQKIIESIVL